MEQTNIEAAMTAKRPQFLTVLCILSFIGSGLWALISIIGMVASGWILSFLGVGMASAMDSASMEGVDLTAEQMQEATEAASGIMGMGTTFFVLIFLGSLILALLSLFGVFKMWKQKKVGFMLYSTVNGLVLIVGLFAGGIFTGVIAAAFIAMYAVNLKHMS